MKFGAGYRRDELSRRFNGCWALARVLDGHWSAVKRLRSDSQSVPHLYAETVADAPRPQSERAIDKPVFRGPWVQTTRLR